MQRRVGLRVWVFLVGLGLGAGLGLLFMWITNSVLARWLGPGAPRMGWGDVACLSVMFGAGMIASMRMLVSLHED